MNTEVKEKNELEEYKDKTFEEIKHIDEFGNINPSQKIDESTVNSSLQELHDDVNQSIKNKTKELIPNQDILVRDRNDSTDINIIREERVRKN